MGLDSFYAPMILGKIFENRKIIFYFLFSKWLNNRHDSISNVK